MYFGGTILLSLLRPRGNKLDINGKQLIQVGAEYTCKYNVMFTYEFVVTVKPLYKINNYNKII